ncbi:Arm DNA-binding domain-containing protein [Sphingobium sp. BYY-5]|uniref:Arm DNA-binding domain-containing protein n=1 Tax=Sphingobium sp. BYY-5 TaxID=2926400 RepID=UPI001FA756F6|nr:Arm DNA-binding domain-containing protein [Sphingobium sp. BYY-5]MCI4588697.1 Arm DNA-binding domain-containing protein [Sphingobium sp. BYY-5]
MLTTVEINALKPREKAYKVADGKGLYLLVQPSGSLLWRVKFRFHGIEKRMALGRYPDVRLTFGLVALDVGQTRDAVSLQAPMQR